MSGSESSGEDEEERPAKRRLVDMGLTPDELRCPICVETISDPFVTSCGHTFCYLCVTTHLTHKATCPTCNKFLTKEQLYPNFLLSKILERANKCSDHGNATGLVDTVRHALGGQASRVNIQDIDSVINVLSEKKEQMRQQESASSLELLLMFLSHARDHKRSKLQQLETQLQFLDRDIATVQRSTGSTANPAQVVPDMWPEAVPQQDGVAAGPSHAALHEQQRSRSEAAVHLGPPHDPHASSRPPALPPRGTLAPLPPPHPSQPHPATSQLPRPGGPVQGDAVASASAMPGVAASGEAQVASRRRRIMAQFQELSQCYLQACATRSARANPEGAGESCIDGDAEGGLSKFRSTLAAATRSERLAVIAELPRPSGQASGILSSLEFDMEGRLFAVAGVMQKIVVYDYTAIVAAPEVSHAPCQDLPTRSKLTSLSWSQAAAQQLVASDYEGGITLWDMAAASPLRTYEAHERRIWSVDFSPLERTRFASGSDDGKVKVWSVSETGSVLSMDLKANVCTVKYSPTDPHLLAVGTAAHTAHVLDLRSPREPLHSLTGHRKAVSYVRWGENGTQLVSASTDSTLRRWNLADASCMSTYTGHTNEKNFVGLSLSAGGEYIACGSETNELYVYHKAMPRPSMQYCFTPQQPQVRNEQHFLSAVCWRRDSSHIMVANSQGNLWLVAPMD